MTELRSGFPQYQRNDEMDIAYEKDPGSGTTLKHKGKSDGLLIWYSREWDCNIDGWVLGKSEKSKDDAWAAFNGCQIYLRYMDKLNNVHCACDLPSETTLEAQYNKGDREYIGWMAIKPLPPKTSDASKTWYGTIVREWVKMNGNKVAKAGDSIHSL